MTQDADTVRRWWVSWYAASKHGPFTLNWPWWISGWAEEGDTICAAIQATSEDEVTTIVRAAHDQPPADITWRFIEERPDDWTPFCDRFEKAEWMTQFDG